MHSGIDFDHLLLEDQCPYHRIGRNAGDSDSLKYEIQHRGFVVSVDFFYTYMWSGDVIQALSECASTLGSSGRIYFGIFHLLFFFLLFSHNLKKHGF
jgi:hypothetical protein